MHEDSQALPPNTIIEEFRIEHVLGAGGFGITYLATDTSLGRQVVIKENLPSQFAFRDTKSGTVKPRNTSGGDADDYEWSMQNFIREAETLASLDHPGIVKVLRKFNANGTACFVMPYVEGAPLDQFGKDRLSEGNPFTEDELNTLHQQLLSALSYLHDRGIYHRDIKPANILIDSSGSPTLIDFGSARQRISERSMTVIESAGYTPFEQLQSKGNVGPWSDLYALGATLVKVITGEAPPRANDRTMGDPWHGLTSNSEIAEAYSEQLVAGIDKALNLRIEERWQSASDWMSASSATGSSKKDEISTTVASSSSGQLVSPTSSKPDIAANKVKKSPWKEITKEDIVAIFMLISFLVVYAIWSSDESKYHRDINTSQIVEDSSGPPISQPPLDPKPAPRGDDKSKNGVVLTTDIPPLLLEGTPKPIRVPGLAPVAARPPELMVPEGTILLSRGKPVSSSDDQPIIGNLNLITDGDKTGGEASFVELLDGLQWVQIDLGASASIAGVWLWHFHSQRRAYNDVIIQVSDDTEFRKNVSTIYNNDYDNSSGLGIGRDSPYTETQFGMLADGENSKGRYVRLWSSGNTSNEMNHYIEVEVFGAWRWRPPPNLPQKVTVTSNPSGADVIKNGLNIGNTPLNINVTPPAQVNFILKLAGYQEQEVSGSVRPLQPIDLHAELQPIKSSASKANSEQTTQKDDDKPLQGREGGTAGTNPRNNNAPIKREAINEKQLQEMLAQNGIVVLYKKYLASLDLKHVKIESVLVSCVDLESNEFNLPPKDVWRRMGYVLKVVDRIARELNPPEGVIVVASYVPNTKMVNHACEFDKHNSWHAANVAVDFNMPGVAAKKVYEFSKALRDAGLFKGGLGICGTNVHLDARGFNVDLE